MVFFSVCLFVCLFVSARVFRFSLSSPVLVRGLERGTSVRIHHQFLSFSSISVQVVESRMFSFLFFWLILSLDEFSFVAFSGVLFRVQSI